MPQGGGAPRAPAPAVASAAPAASADPGSAAAPPVAVVVTRPDREAGPWTAGLRQAGLDPRLLPLIAIGPTPDPQALARSGQALPGAAAAMFVSANAARAFLEARPGPWPEGTRAWATGPGTRSALLAGGVPEAAIDTPPDDAGQPVEGRGTPSNGQNAASRPNVSGSIALPVSAPMSVPRFQNRYSDPPVNQNAIC